MALGGFISGGGAGKAKINTATGNVTLGPNAGLQFNSDDLNNIAIGTNALDNAGSGLENCVGIGTNALSAITIHDGNVGIGANAGAAHNAARAVIIGQDAGKQGDFMDSVIIGALAIDATTNSCQRNVIIGKEAASVSTGIFTENIIMGYRAANGSGVNNAVGNVIIGHEAAPTLTSGDKNIFIGEGSGYSVSSGSDNIHIGYYTGVEETGTYSGYLTMGNGGKGLQRWSTTVKHQTYGAAQGDDNTAASVALAKFPQYSFISRVIVMVVSLGTGTHKYNVSLGTAADEAIGDTVAGRIELLGATDGTGCITRSQGSQGSDSDIDASTGATNKMTWTSDISPGTDNSDGWLDNDMYLYLCNAGTGNLETDPGGSTHPSVSITVEYYGKD